MAKRRPKDRVQFNCPETDRAIIRKISRRARDLYLQHEIDRSALDIDMDVTATHCNGNPLRLTDLLAADDFNLLHDIGGIARHLDRNTGKLTGCFRPRFSQPASAKAA